MWLTHAGGPQVDFQPALHKLVGVCACYPSPCRRLEDLKFKVVPGNLNGELRVLVHSGVDTVSQGDKNAFKE